MIVIPKEEAYESVRNRVWYPPACENKEEHIKFLFKGCQEMDIVFCKDCRFSEIFQNDSSGVMAMYCRAFTFERMVAEDDYCSYGERRDE